MLSVINGRIHVRNINNIQNILKALQVKRFLIYIFLIASSKLFALTNEQKVGQLLLVHFNGLEANEEAALMLREAHVGGFIFYNWSNALESPEQVRKLTSTLNQLNKELGAPAPLLFAVDQEGGRVSRLHQGFTSFPSPAKRAATQLPMLEELTAEAIGKELKSVGINLNFSPIVDINSNPSFHVMGDRSYGNDPTQVTLFAKAALVGYKRAGILASLKHFPGHGDAGQDSHHILPVVKKSKEALQRCELYPYFELAKDSPVVMTAHLKVTALDPFHPATLSSAILDELLRQEMGFKGVVISDSLVMKGLEGTSYEELALKALLAGCDMLCLGGKLLNEPSQAEITPQEVLKIHHYLVSALKEGRFSQEMLDQKVERIVQLKAGLPLSSESYSPSAHQKLKEELDLFGQIRLSLTPEVIDSIAHKIGSNECGPSQDKLIWWSPNEPFLSVGIGHFIWFPKDQSPPYEEGFKLYRRFLEQKGIPLPEWLGAFPPWNTREEFLKDQNGEEAARLRTWLLETVALQGEFMIERLFFALHRIISQADEKEFPSLFEKINALSTSSEGVFALVDYLNFKGEGLSEKESYQGTRWGLYQVLQSMQPPATLASFKTSAKEVLEKRVAASPQEKGEARWLLGWKNRIERY